MNQRKKLPIDVSNLPEMIQGNYVYVDKTDIVHKIITGNRYYFFSRPRRFGKSLLVSTLKELFLGNKKLFENLWIAQHTDYAWPEHPVIHLDLLKVVAKNPEALEESLLRYLAHVGQDYNVDVTNEPYLGGRLDALVRNLASRGKKVVILIDEYDQPIIKNMHNPAIAIANRDVLREFYGCLKSLDEHLRFLFLTGVGKFSKTSIFSGLNNLNDISLDPFAAPLLGYTEEELHTYFLPYIDEMAQNRHCSRAAIIDEMRTWYNGYRFSRATTKVFNPFSVLYYLHKQNRANYWFESGTPTFLIEVLKSNKDQLTEIDHLLASQSTLQMFEIESPNLEAVLYQTGYLTIEKEYPDDDMFLLTYPNTEVRQSLSAYVASILLNTETSKLEAEILKIKQTLERKDIATFHTILTKIFADIPYEIHLPIEAYYHSLFQLFGILLGLDFQSEVMTSVGRIDMVIQTKKYVYILEFKFNKPIEEALSQIEDRRYHEKYLTSGKEIVRIGMVFTHKAKKLHIEWKELPTA